MSDLITERTPLIVAAEINTIKQHTQKVVLNNAIEIGRRLKEIKEMLPHGEWLKWLEESVSYTERTAQNLIRIFESYGDKQSATLNAGDQTQQKIKLSYSQALILLGVPEEERERFITELDIENMSVRELQKAVKDRDQALQERDLAFLEKVDFQQALNDEQDKITQLTEERDTLKIKADELQQVKLALEQDVYLKQSEVEKLKESSGYKNIQRMNGYLTVAYNKVAANQIAFLYENLDKAFKQLSYEMARFAQIDPEAHAAYRKQVNDFLIKAMEERM